MRQLTSGPVPVRSRSARDSEDDEPVRRRDLTPEAAMQSLRDDAEAVLRDCLLTAYGGKLARTEVWSIAPLIWRAVDQFAHGLRAAPIHARADIVAAELLALEQHGLPGDAEFFASLGPQALASPAVLERARLYTLSLCAAFRSEVFDRRLCVGRVGRVSDADFAVARPPIHLLRASPSPGQGDRLPSVATRSLLLSLRAL